MNRILRNSLIGLGALALAGCGSKVEEVYPIPGITSENTSLGKTKIIRHNNRFSRDSRTVIIANSDTTWVFYDHIIGKPLGANSRDRVDITSDLNLTSLTTYGISQNQKIIRMKSLLDGDSTYSFDKNSGEKAISLSKSLIEKRFNQMYNQAISEASDSTEAALLRIVESYN